MTDPARQPTKCPQCWKPIETPVRRRIRVNRQWQEMTFCSATCGGNYQMGCEG